MTRVLVLSAIASAINYIESLSGDPSIELHATDADRFSPGFYRPGVKPHCVPPARDTMRYRAALDRIIEAEGIDAVIPTSDYDMEGATAYLRDGWEPRAALFRPSFETFRNLNDTSVLAGILDGVLPHLRPRTFRAGHDMTDATFPLVLKPLNLSGGRGVVFVDDRATLNEAAQRMQSRYGANFVAQEFIPGQTYVSTLIYDHDGRLVAGAAMRSTMTFFTWGGGGIAGEMVEQSDLLEIAQQVVAACGGWRGPVNLEWRRHPDTGRFYVLEANCRLNGYSYLTTMNGLNLPRIVLDTLLGRPISTPLAVPPTRNFVIGYREEAVDDWVAPAS